MMLTELAGIARKTGYPVVEVPGWKTRGRPGGMLGVRTITCHHTANGGAKGNYPSLRVVRDGRSGLPGPLAQLGLGVDGTIYVIAAGKCNHAGVSRETRYTNSYAIGIEAEAEGVPGDLEDWPARQMDAYVRLCRVLVDYYGLTSTDVRGHKETCSPVGRKSDPDFSMPAFRARVRTLHPGKLAAASTTSKGDTVAERLDPADVKAIAVAVVQQTIYNENETDAKRAITTVGAALTDLDVTQERDRVAVINKLDTLIIALGELAIGLRTLTATVESRLPAGPAQ